MRAVGSRSSGGSGGCTQQRPDRAPQRHDCPEEAPIVVVLFTEREKTQAEGFGFLRFSGRFTNEMLGKAVKLFYLHNSHGMERFEIPFARVVFQRLGFLHT